MMPMVDNQQQPKIYSERSQNQNQNQKQPVEVSETNHGTSQTQLQLQSMLNSATTYQDESFSACILVMDENFRLYEWIAYHYHVLPLRYLVVAVDARSAESPEPVIDLFRQHLNMTILMWKDSDFVTWDQPLPPDADMHAKRSRYLERQRRFLAQCVTHLYEQNRTWTAMWDVDEYVAFHGYNQTRHHPTSNSSVATSPHDMSEAGSILRYLKDYGEENGVGMNRILVGSREDPSITNESHPFDYRRFDSLRYRYRAKPGDHINGWGKCLLNVNKISSFHVQQRSPHRPVRELCPTGKGDHLHQSPFLLNHFIGSWEAYSYRDDSRRGRERSHQAYLKQAQKDAVYEHKMAPWMTAFVTTVGKERASILLQHAGLDPEYNATHKIESFQVLIPS